MFLEKDDPLLSKVSHPAWDPQKKLPFWRDKERTILTFRRLSCQGLGLKAGEVKAAKHGAPSWKTGRLCQGMKFRKFPAWEKVAEALSCFPQTVVEGKRYGAFLILSEVSRSRFSQADFVYLSHFRPKLGISRGDWRRRGGEERLFFGAFCTEGLLGKDFFVGIFDAGGGPLFGLKS